MHTTISKTPGFVTFLVLVLLLPLCSLNAYAQSTSAELRGAVEDQAHAMIPNATITARNIGTGIVRIASSNEQGAFSIPDLQPATYLIIVSAPSFSSVRYANVVLTVGAQQVLNVTLSAEQVNQNIVVQSTAPGVELTSSNLGGIVQGRTVRELPLNGRDWSTLALLEPGVSSVRTQNNLNGSSSNRSSRGLGSQVTVNGNRPTQNSYFLDGISVNDYANGTPGGAFGLALGVDAIQEFSVVTSNYNATYGQASGGIINAVTRSGTNQFHGDVYEFLRNDFFDARNYFDGPAIAPLRRNQFGVAVGGPLWKNRTFLFGNYEGLRWVGSNTITATVPSANARLGILSTGKVTVSPAVVPFLKLWPLPNAGLNGAGDVGSFKFVARNPQFAHFGTLKLDHQFSANDNASAAYSIDDSSTSGPDALNSTNVTTTLRRDTESVSESHIFSSTFLNTARIGVNRVTAHGLNSSPGNNPAAMDPSLGILPGRFASFLSVPTLTSYTGGLNGLATTNFAYTTYQGYDDITIQKRAHTFRAGADFVHYTSNMQVASSPNGEYDFKSLSNFLTNKPNIFFADLAFAPGQTTGAPIGVGFPERGFRQNTLGAYFQDDWRILSNLTLNLGLRYERSNVPTEEHGRVSNIYDLTTTNLNPGAPLFSNPTNRDFEPRVGFVYDPFKRGETSVRGSAGIFDVLPLIYEIGLLEAYSAPTSSLAQIGNQPAGSFPNGGYNYILSGKPIPLRVGSIQRNPARNYIVQYNLSVQQQLTPSTTLLIAYAGNHGVHMSDLANDANYGKPVLTPNGYQFNAATRNAALGGVRQLTWRDSSSYNGLQVKVEKRFARGFQFQGSYTWSRSIDGYSSSSFPTTFQNSLSLLFFNLKLNRGPSDFNVAQVAVINGLWDLPKLAKSSSIVEGLANGWSLGGILQFDSGMPFTPVISGDALNEGISSPYDVPNLNLNAPGCNHHPTNPGNPNHYINVSCFSFAGAYNANPALNTGVLGNAGRNSLVGPGVAELDVSATRNFDLHFISEASRLQFRADVFNVSNHTNFLPPLANNKIFGVTGSPVATAGIITLTSTSSRQMQLALKYIW